MLLDLPKLDVKDKKILFELDRDARQPVSEIAKIVGLNKNTVNYKIHRLHELGVIKGYYAVIDNSKLGYFFVRVYFNFINTTAKIEKEITDWLCAQKKVGVVSKIETTYDLCFMVLVKNIYEYEVFSDEFKRLFRKYVQNEHVNIFTKVYHYPRKYLREDSDPYKEELIVGGSHEEEHDDLDIEILKLIAGNPRIPLLDVAKKLNTPERTIAFRLKKLEQKKVILGYRANIDLAKIGYEYYKINFILGDFDKFTELVAFCRVHKNVTYIDKTIEELDFEIDLEVASRQELLQLLQQIKDNFSVRETQILVFKEYYKLEMLPSS